MPVTDEHRLLLHPAAAERRPAAPGADTAPTSHSRPSRVPPWLPTPRWPPFSLGGVSLNGVRLRIRPLEGLANWWNGGRASNRMPSSSSRRSGGRSRDSVKYARLDRHRLNNNFDLDSDNSSGTGGMGNIDSAYTSSPGVAVRQMRFSMRICGPKLSLCCTLVSAWGIIQLLVMWLAFSSRSVAFVEDIRMNMTVASASEKAYEAEMEEGYEKAANNCKVAALLYLVTLVVAGHQRWLNSRPQPQGYTRYT